MRNEAENKNNLYFYFAGLFLLLFYYVPFLFETTAVVHIHDNLDDALPKYKLVYFYFKDGISNLALNGNLSIFALPVLLQPSNLFYLINNHEVAYLLNDIFVRLIAYFGVLLLANYFRAGVIVSVLTALMFSFSVSYTSFGLSVAGLPVVLWVLLTADNHKTKLDIALKSLLVFMVGMDVWLSLSGLFFLILIFPILLVLKARLGLFVFLYLFVFTAGMVLGNLNIIFMEKFSGVVWHRTEFAFIKSHPISVDGIILNIKNIIKNTLYFKSSIWYHMTYATLGVALIVAIILSFFTRNRTQVLLILSLILLAAVQYELYYGYIYNYLVSVGGIFVSLNLARFFFVVSLLVVLAVLLVGRVTGKRFAILSSALVLQIMFVLYATPHWNAVARLILSKPASETYSKINTYYEPEWFNEVKKYTDEDTIISVGIDPMKAVVNKIPTLDGYYQMYPLEYKNKFRDVIRISLQESGRADYYNYWGSRVYTFHDPDKPESIDFCAANKLGAKYIVSSKYIFSKQASLVLQDENETRFLYEIKCE